MKIAISSSAGSIQNDVVAAPPQLNIRRGCRDQRLRRVHGDGEAEAEADAVIGRFAEQRARHRRQVAPPGRWFDVISFSVFGPSSLTPPSSPPLSSARQKVR
jgi:hypothetical protein